jgi:hypothetical protein
MAKPTQVPRWAKTVAGSTAENVVEPPEGQKDTGYTLDAVPTSAGLNWIFVTLYAWILWLVEATSAATAGTLVQRDGSGRARVADPADPADIDTMGARATAIGVEATARATADSTEATTRAAADSVLDGRVTTLENATASGVALVVAPGVTKVVTQGSPPTSHCLTRSIAGVVTAHGGLYNVDPSVGPVNYVAGTVLASIPTGYRPTKHAGYYFFARAWLFTGAHDTDATASLPTEVVVRIRVADGTPAGGAKGDLDLPFNDFPPNSFLLFDGAAWYAGA